MITGESIIAKIVISIVAKTASSLASIVIDKRKKACRTLVKLYHAVVSLEETTNEFLEFATFTAHTSHASALLSAARSIGYKFEIPSNAFIDISRELEEGLMIIDPALAKSLAILYSGKADFLSFLSCSIETREINGNHHLIIYKPNSKILETDFERAYTESQAAILKGENYYWPSGVFDYFNDFEEFDISTASEEAAVNLIQMIQEHHQLLKQASEEFRNLLVKNFSVDELLFLPRRAA